MNSIYYTHWLTKSKLDKFIPDTSYILDDGLFSHYYYANMVESFNVKLAICTSFIDTEKHILRKQYTIKQLHIERDVTPEDYICSLVKNKDKQYFLTLEELKFIFFHTSIEIIAHSHFHDVCCVGITKNINFSKCWYDLHKIQVRKSLNIKLGSKLANNCMKSSKVYEDFIRYDTECMLNFFYKHLKYTPNKYVFPFNQSSEKLVEILKYEFNFTKFYGKERLLID